MLSPQKLPALPLSSRDTTKTSLVSSRRRSLSPVKLPPLLHSRDSTDTPSVTEPKRSPRRSRKSRREKSNAMKSASEHGIASKLLSRAQTLLRGATIRRDSDANNTISGDVTARNFAPVMDELQREKTNLESQLFPDANLKHVRLFFDAQRNRKTHVVWKEQSDSDFDTDLEDDISECSLIPTPLIYHSSHPSHNT